MSKKKEGRKQHYIPQMLLRGFARKKIVLVCKQKEEYPDSISNVAAMRDFYSTSADMTLDKVISDHESKSLQLHLQNLRNNGNGESVCSEIAAEIVHSFTVRANYVRKLVNNFMLKIMSDVLHTDASNNLKNKISEDFHEFGKKMILQDINKRYRSSKNKLPPQQLIQEKIDSYFEQYPEHVEKALRSAYDKVIEFEDCYARMIQTNVRGGHNRGLTELFIKQEYPEHLKQFNWKILKNSSNFDFILPDCVSINLSQDKAYPAVMTDKNDVTAIITPLDKNTLLVGTKNNFEFDVSLFNQYAAEGTLEFFVCHPEFKHTNTYRNFIGKNCNEFIVEQSNSSISDFFNIKK